MYRLAKHKNDLSHLRYSYLLLVFPFLQHFTISDGDFNELDAGNFHQVNNSRLETWCLVRKNNIFL